MISINVGVEIESEVVLHDCKCVIPSISIPVREGIRRWTVRGICRVLVVGSRIGVGLSERATRRGYGNMGSWHFGGDCLVNYGYGYEYGWVWGKGK